MKQEVVVPVSYQEYAHGMKISVSLPRGDVEFLDEIAKTEGYASRSAAVAAAIRLLRASRLGAEYEAAFRESEESGDRELWDSIAGETVS